MDHKTFRYREQLAKGEIRLLLIFGDSFGAPLRCKLIKACFEHEPAYEALSYTWGAPILNRSVEIDGRTHSITHNLYDALQYLRPSAKDASLTLWVDAVCINQTDLVEKTAQVRDMDDVFRCASSVHVWLGPAMPGLEDALQVTIRLCEDSFNLQTFCRDYRHFKDIFKRPWFSRLWVLQEAIVARKLLVHVGHSTCDGMGLMTADTLVLQNGGDRLLKNVDRADHELVRQGLSQVTNFRILTWASDPTSSADKMPLLIMLRMSRAKGCADPRDHYFGLIGNLKRAKSGLESLLPDMDYSRSMASLFTEITAAGVEHSTGLARLSAVHNEDRDSSTAEETSRDRLPSWVPDWSRPPAARGFRTLIYQSGNALEGKTEVDGDLLVVQGIVIGRVSECLYRSKTKSLDKEVFRSAVIRGLVSSTNYSDQFEAFARTAIADNIQDLDEDWKTTRWPLEDPLLRCMPWCDKDTVKEAFDQLVEREGTASKWHQFSEARWRLYIDEANTCLKERSVYVSDAGHYVLGPSGTQPGDTIAVLAGAPLPFVLRPRGDGFYMIGPAYVHGIMDGEVPRMYSEGKYQLEKLKIY